MNNITDTSTPEVYTISFSGTACTRDEGETTREDSNKNMYSDDTGYIPVRIHKEIAGKLEEANNCISVRGSGQNDWAIPRSKSEPLELNGPLAIPHDLYNWCSDYASGDQCSNSTQVFGSDIAALSVHGANKAVASGAKVINMIGHSRGAVSAIIAAWFIYAYGPQDIKINIFAIDPVPGPGNWWSTHTTLAPNVNHYVGIYSWDTNGGESAMDYFLTPVVPYPNDSMVKKKLSFWQFDSPDWQKLGDNVTTPDPLGNSNQAQPINYDLYACRGKHSTLSGNMTTDGLYDPVKNSKSVEYIPKLVYLMARTYLTQWGTLFKSPCAVNNSSKELRLNTVKYHKYFDNMGGGIYRTSKFPDRPYVRRVSSSSGIDWSKKSFMEDVVGNPPYEQYYPVTEERNNHGWVKWNFL